MWTCSALRAVRTCSTGFGASGHLRRTDEVVGCTPSPDVVFHQLPYALRYGHIRRTSEGGGVRQETAVQGDTVGDNGHTGVAHAVAR